VFALLEIMDALHEPSEEILGNVGPYFDPYQAPDRFVPLLARWVDLERYLVDLPPEATPASRFAPGLGRLRELINAVAFLSKWRGTAKGLRLFLETATGIEGFVIDEQAPGPDGLPRPFHIRVHAPAEAQHYHELIRRVVEQYVVKIESPSGAPAGSHAFRLDMVGVANPDEEYSQGPTITFTTPPPAETGPAFPWWIPVAAVVILLIAVVAIWRPWERETVIPPAEVQIPDFAAAGLRVGDAEATVTGIPASRRAGRSPRSRPEWLR
jgi:phage tail-like protein